MNDIPARVLREALRGRMAPAAPAGCIDSETLAAWSDGALSARERAAAELHASSCARCQSLLAVMARTLPPGPARKRWSASTGLAWLTPLAAAAVAVLLWIYVPRPLFESSVPGRAVRQRSGQAGEPASAPTASAQAPSSAASSPSVSVDRLADSTAVQRQDIPPAPPVAHAPKRSHSLSRESRATTELRDAAAAPPPAATMQSGGEAPGPKAAAKPAPTAAAVAPPAPPISVFESTSVTNDQTASGLRARVMSKASSGAAEILTPDANVRWRLLTAGDVARSIDGGMTWQTQSTGVSARLTAGSAPSPAICWLVGPGGIIVMSIDGQSWRRVPFPEAIDLTSIRASDGVTATVTAADGRTFATTDGGKTWRSP
jgi:hypothetical protein